METCQIQLRLKTSLQQLYFEERFDLPYPTPILYSCMLHSCISIMAIKANTAEVGGNQNKIPVPQNNRATIQKL